MAKRCGVCHKKIPIGQSEVGVYTGTRVVIAELSNGDNANNADLGTTSLYVPRRNFFMTTRVHDRQFRFGQASRPIVTCDYSSTRIGRRNRSSVFWLARARFVVKTSIQNDLNSRAWTP
jgi:hypothetical protein